jgi:TRAP-type C4-dicarboxylate transport system permease small subunit
MTKAKVKAKGGSSNLLQQALVERAQIILSICVDCLFIALWFAAAWSLNEYVVERLKNINGVDELALSVFQWVSGLATLGILIVQTLRDFAIIVIRSYRAVREEIKNGKTR